MTEAEVVNRIRSSEFMTANASQIQSAVLSHFMGKLRNLGHEFPGDKAKQLNQQQLDIQLLENIGPAAAACHVDSAIATYKERNRNAFNGIHLNGSFVNNMTAITRNFEDNIYTDFSNTLRSQIMVRGPFLEFDLLTDPRHLVDFECGYPRAIWPMMYRYLYDRDDVARRVNDIYTDESWAADPIIYEKEEDEIITPFEEDIQELCIKQKLMQFIYRLDKLCGIGHYGVLLYGIDDSKPLEEPVDSLDELGNRKPGSKDHKILYMRPFDEVLAYVKEYDRDTSSPRYGLPLFYNLIFMDLMGQVGAQFAQQRINQTVHWHRVTHVAEGCLTSPTFGDPRARGVFNRLLDLRKIKGSSTEMFWKGGFPGLFFEIDPRVQEDEIQFDKEEFKEEMRKYSEGLQRIFPLVGISVKSIAPAIADPTPHVLVHLSAIAAYKGIPFRIWQGSEEGRLASQEDKLNWNQRLKMRFNRFLEPDLIRPVADKLITLGAVRPPGKDGYKVGATDLNSSTSEAKANLALKWTQALSQYVASGIIHMIPPMEFLVTIMGLEPVVAIRIIKQVESSGGWAKLKAVDPAKGAGANGKRQDIASGDSKTADGQQKKRDSNQKSAEGTSS